MERLTRKIQITTVTLVLLISIFAPIALTIGPTQPPVDTTTLYVGRDGWGPAHADPVTAYDPASCELLFNCYDTLISMGRNIQNQWGNWHVKEEHWQFELNLATKISTSITKMALIVGEGNWRFADESAQGVASLLQTHPDWKWQVELLINATRDEILQGLENIRNAAPDYALFYFAGHGTNSTDQNPIDEIDGADEYICAFDSNISDDYFTDWVRQVPKKTNLAIILDSCHSGGFIGITNAHTIERDGNPEQLSDRDYSIVLTAAGDLTSPPNPPKDEQLAWDWLDHQKTKFTYHLLEALGTTTKLEPAFEDAKTKLKNCDCNITGSPQSPLMNDHYLTKADPSKDYDLASTEPCVGTASCYDFYIRTDDGYGNPINFYDETGAIVDTFDIYDAEYSFKRGLVQDQYGSPMWMFYKLFFDQMNSDFWDTGNPEDAYRLAFMIDNSIQIISVDPPVLRINLGILFPEAAFKQILSQPWASIVSKEFSISIGCWDGDLFHDFNSNGYPDWWDDWRHVASSPYDTGKRYVGTGPYHVPAQSQSLVILERNSNYWKGWPAPNRKSYLEYINIEYIADWSWRRDAFKACQLDICDVPRTYMMELLDPTDSQCMNPILPEIKTIKNISPVLSIDAFVFCFTINPASTAIYTGSFPDGIPTSFFDNQHVRKAFAYAFNHSQYLNEVCLGEAICRETVCPFGMAPDYYCYAPDPPRTYYKDLTKIRLELEQAIFTQDVTTQSVWDWGGFHMDIVYPSGDDQLMIACEMIKWSFDEINNLYGKNFQIDIMGLDEPAYVEKRQWFELPMCSINWQADYSDPDSPMRSFMHSYGQFAYFQNYTSWNGWTILGPRTGLDKDTLIDLGVETPDGPAREEIYKDIDDIYILDCPSFPIAQTLGRQWMKYWVKGWYYNPLYPSDYYYHLYKEDTCWADITGPSPTYLPDGVCNMRDIGWIAARFGAKAPNPAGTPMYDPKWTPGVYGSFGCDVYGDRKVDMRDIGFAASHWMHSTQP